MQTERAYQKQQPIFQNSKTVLLGGSRKKKDQRFVRNVGLGFKTPREASCMITGVIQALRVICAWLNTSLLCVVLIILSIILYNLYLNPTPCTAGD